MFKKSWQLTCFGMGLILAGCTTTTEVRTPVAAVSSSPIPLAAPKEVWMTDFQQINGTPYLYAPIYVAEQEQKSVLKQMKSASYGGRQEYATDIRNYMFVHRDNLSAAKLLPNNSSRVLELEQIGERLPLVDAGNDRTNRTWIKTVKTLWYVRVTADTNGDKLLSDLDRKQIAISDVSSANYTEIIQDIDKILLVYPKGLDRRLVFYTSGNKHFVADVDLLKRQARIEQLPALK
jgi:hypothetical protein